MIPESDPFRHHPELRDLIADPQQSYFRSFTLADVEARMIREGRPGGWWRTDEDREALRARALSGRREDDLWVFAYGSLMWDPAIRFSEVRRARVPGFARCFILKALHGSRGDEQNPGLMAALDICRRGTACEGLLYRIPQALIEAETEILWRREQLGYAYIAQFVAAETGQGPVEALTFVADHEAEIIDPSLTYEQQVRYIATGKGFLGTSLDYLRNIHVHFETLGIHDDELAQLLRDAEAYAAA